MYLSSINYGNTLLNEYAINTPVDEESKTAIIVFINILLFGSVLIFVGVFLWNFIRAYQGKEPLEFKFGKKGKKELSNSMKTRFSEKKNNFSSMRENFKPKTKTCNICGESNDIDAKFCKNCGTRL